ncbi:hypothetical protein DFH11DRAFT_1588044, partial [Phellopilus nigrolimitatus]
MHRLELHLCAISFFSLFPIVCALPVTSAVKICSADDIWYWMSCIYLGCSYDFGVSPTNVRRLLRIVVLTCSAGSALEFILQAL